MARSSAHSLASLLVAAFLVVPPAFAFDTPLSDTAVREAYFLGQRRDDSMARLLSRYTQLLPPPDSGPHISSVTFLTPFALLVQQSSQRVNYSAQQAQKDHHSDQEIVAISIEILLTKSYGALIPKSTGSRSGSSVGYQFRNPDFWNDFKYRVFDRDNELKPDSLTGDPLYNCPSDGACDLYGATIHIQLPAAAFTSGTATIEVDPKVSDPTSVDFDLTSLR
jgi:hypothetical protein